MTIKMKYVGIVTALVAGTLQCSASTLQVDAQNDPGTLVLDNAGVGLDVGASAVHGDGDLVELGYFSTSSDTFAGTWIPLTGPESNNPSLVTTIGDLPSGGTLALAGSFVTQNVFNDSGVTPTNNDIPGTGVQLALRFYDGSSSAGSMYNTVTSTSWLWTTLKAIPIPPDTIKINLAADVLKWEADGGSAFRTALVPEPSSTALLGLGGLALFRRRRR